MTENSRTQGEILFEQYLSAQGLSFEFEKEHIGKSQRPDYTINWRGATVVFDVKDFDPPEKFPTGFGAFDPYPRVREKIDQGRKKFKQYKEFCCGLVLRNLGDPFVMLDKPDIMLGAMYGDSGFTFPVDTSTGVGNSSKMKRAFLDNGKMIQPRWLKPQNTTLSAVITLIIHRPHYQLLVEMIRAYPRRLRRRTEAHRGGLRSGARGSRDDRVAQRFCQNAISQRFILRSLRYPFWFCARRGRNCGAECHVSGQRSP
jgi:hypothetical protein